MSRFASRSLSTLVLLTAFVAGPAVATVELRVEGRPPTDPIQTFVRVTNGGVPVIGLDITDFSVRIDGELVSLLPEYLTLPPAEDPNQHVSVVFTMDYTSSVTDIALEAMQTAVIDFINAMDPGDMAAIIKFNNDSGPTVVAAFTEISADNSALADAVLAPYPGDGSNILDAANVAVQQFSSTTLPDGPKAVILITDGKDSHSSDSLEEVVASASDGSIPIFTIGVGNPNQSGLDVLTGLAEETGGLYFDATDGDEDIAAAYLAIRNLLNGEYLISIPFGDITDCSAHALEVTVSGQSPESVQFTRRQCDTTPDSFSFASETDVREGSAVTSNEVTISGIEVPAHISVIQGRYSIGCTDTFTNDPGTIGNGDTVCIRHTAADQASTSRTTTLTIGGVAATFTSTTGADSGGGGGGGGDGGGGATGLIELLLGLGLLLGRRKLAR
jgi:hypothetical protein